MHPEKLNEIENFYSGILKKAKNVATSPKTGKVIGGVYKEAKSVSANLNPAGKFLNKMSDAFLNSGLPLWAWGLIIFFVALIFIIVILYFKMK